MGTASRWAAKLGRFIILAFFFVMILRGIFGALAPPARSQTATPPQSTERAWPDDQARAFAVSFARAYFDYDPNRVDQYERDLTAYIDEMIGTRVVPTWDKKASRQVVRSTTVEKQTSVSQGKALVTVAVVTDANKSTETRYLSVPVAKDRSGGLVVYALPSLTAGPYRGTVAEEQVESLPLYESGLINDLLSRFFKAYLGGDAAAVAAGPALPGARLGASPVRLELDQVTNVGLVGPAKGKTLEVVATVAAKDQEATYSLTYRLRLVKGDRWYVAVVNQETK